MMEERNGHSIFSPSQLYRILKCPASLNETLARPPSAPSVYAERGTFLHEMVELLFEHGEGALMRRADLTEDEKHAVKDCYGYVNFVRASLSNITSEGGEQTVSMATWGLPEVYGTCDYHMHADDETHVFDWKFGKGVMVYAEENEQMMAYAAGIIGYPIVGNRRVTLHICQPFLDHWDKWTLSYRQLRQWVEETLKPGIDEARSTNPSYVPGAKQCRFCAARRTCRARYKQAQASAVDIFKAVQQLREVPEAVSIEEMERALLGADQYISYINDIKEYLTNRIKQGQQLKEWKLVAGRKSRRWADENQAIAWLSEHSTIKEDDLFKKSFISPAQVEKLDPSLKQDAAFKSIVSESEGGPQLVQMSHKKPPLSFKTPTEVFAEYVEVQEDE